MSTLCWILTARNGDWWTGGRVNSPDSIDWKRLPRWDNKRDAKRAADAIRGAIGIELKVESLNFD